MNVRRLAWLGTRTHDYEATKDFVARVLGLPLVAEEDAGLAVFRLPSGDHDYVEVFSDANPEAECMTTGPVVGLVVDDVTTAAEEIEREGFDIVQPITWLRDFEGFEHATGYAWFQFRGPDGNVYCVMQGSTAAAPRRHRRRPGRPSPSERAESEAGSRGEWS